MNKPLILFFIFLSVVNSASAQDIKEIKLRSAKTKYHPKLYHIVDVADDRQDTTNIGTMRAGLSNKLVTIDLKGGARTAIIKFTSGSLEQDTNTTAVALHITRLEVSEKNNDGRQQADLVIGIAFYKDGILLVEYTGSGYMQSGMDVSMHIEKLVRENLMRGLQELDKWLQNREANSTKAAKTQVKLLSKYNNDEDVLVYSKHRPLQVLDFQGRPDDLSMGAAGTYSGFALNYTYQETSGGTILNIELAPLFFTNKSWFKEHAKNKYTLNHEQKHFDITAMVTCELADSVRKAVFSPKNFTKEIADLQKYYQDVLDDRQQQYDTETNHGLEKEQQQQWNEWIATRLETLSCYE